MRGATGPVIRALGSGRFIYDQAMRDRVPSASDVVPPSARRRRVTWWARAVIAAVAAALVATVPSVPVAAAGSYSVITSWVIEKDADCGDLGACNIRMDAYVPAKPVTGSVVVLLHGGPAGLGARAGGITVTRLASALAARGILAFSADYRDLASQGASYDHSLGDVACAVAKARSIAPRWGVSGKQVILVGISLGGWIGADATLLRTLPGPCGKIAAAHPDSFYGLSGAYNMKSVRRVSDMALFFGSGVKPDLRLDTLAIARKTHRHIVYHIAAERHDPVVSYKDATVFASRLGTAGDQVSLTVFRGSVHSTPANPTTADGLAVLRMIAHTALAPGK